MRAEQGTRQRAAPEERAERQEHPGQVRRAEVEEAEERHVDVLVAAALRVMF